MKVWIKFRFACVKAPRYLEGKLRENLGYRLAHLHTLNVLDRIKTIYVENIRQFLEAMFISSEKLDVQITTCQKTTYEDFNTTKEFEFITKAHKKS